MVVIRDFKHAWEFERTIDSRALFVSGFETKGMDFDDLMSNIQLYGFDWNGNEVEIYPDSLPTELYEKLCVMVAEEIELALGAAYERD